MSATIRLRDGAPLDAIVAGPGRFGIPALGQAALRKLLLSIGAISTCSALAAAPMVSRSGSTAAINNEHRTQKMTEAHPYVGMWVTDDGQILHQRLPTGRYDEARGTKESAYRGRYRVTGDHIDYVDDTGFTADGDFIDGVLHHAGMILRRVPEEKPS